jgi:hypothetical protein
MGKMIKFHGAPIGFKQNDFWSNRLFKRFRIVTEAAGSRTAFMTIDAILSNAPLMNGGITANRFGILSKMTLAALH